MLGRLHGVRRPATSRCSSGEPDGARAPGRRQLPVRRAPAHCQGPALCLIPVLVGRTPVTCRNGFQTDHRIHRGTGEEGMGLAYRFAKAGNACIIGSRSIEKAQGAVAELREKDAALDLTPATNADAAARGEIVVVTTPYAAQADTLPPLAAALAGKVVVSTVVPMSFEAGRASLLAVPRARPRSRSRRSSPARRSSPRSRTSARRSCSRAARSKPTSSSAPMTPPQRSASSSSRRRSRACAASMAARSPTRRWSRASRCCS